MIGMGVGDDDRMDIFDLQLCLFQTVLEGFEGTRRGESRIDDRRALRVRNRIAVDVAESWHGDRELHPKYVRGDFDDFLGGWLLFLATCFFLRGLRFAHSRRLPNTYLDGIPPLARDWINCGGPWVFFRWKEMFKCQGWWPIKWPS